VVVEALFVHLASELRRFLVGLLRDEHAAADALQRTFARVVQLGHTAAVDTRRAWVFRVAYHEAMQLRRAASVDQRARATIGLDPGRPAWHVEDPVEVARRNEDGHRVREALSQLPEAQREVVRQRIYEGRTFAAIAEHLGLPLGTVLSRMHLATRKLRQALQDPE
jgi:RNA polymerase sigma-70 factor (ECF subfamily)